METPPVPVAVATGHIAVEEDIRISVKPHFARQKFYNRINFAISDKHPSALSDNKESPSNLP
jgi:hypothetical protein